MISNDEEELLSPEKTGFPRLSPDDLKGGVTVAESVKIFLNILDGNGTRAQKSVVAVNSGLALKKMFPSKNLQECISVAEESLQEGKAKSILNRLLNL